MPSIWTIGHSTRAIEEFLSLLHKHRIEIIADVRRFPMSRRYPHYNREPFRDSLAAAKVDYLWLPQLGGRRSPVRESRNTAWRNAGFRGYADHMESEEFAEGLAELLNASSGARTAIMCAEAVSWRCHRALISDVLLSLGHSVLHIEGARAPRPHTFTPPARIAGGVLSYEADGQRQLALDDA